jgi:U3 small nucleolar ribonucleoprotein protein LCP5
MTVENASLTSLLNSLCDSLNSATTVLTENQDRFLPPQDGISLLDVKTELLLSYLQNLAFLILFKIRNSTTKQESKGVETYNDVVEKLIELRVYLERGVRPIEQRLKYTIDQYLQAAQRKKNAPPPRTYTGHYRDPDDSDPSDSDSDASLDQAPIHDPTTSLEDAAHAPRLTSLALNTDTRTKPSTSTTTTTSNPTGVYKPPRHAPTSMPSQDPDTSTPHNSHRRAHKSALLNEYITSELSSAPLAQPSIGSNNTILARGRTGLSASQQARERERTEYEERNFTRLPGESKAEKRKAKRQERERGGARDLFGGEDWTGLGGLGEGISRSVARGKEGRETKLGRREKRRATEDAPRGDGMGGIGESFEKRRKVLAGRAERKGGRRR